MNETKALEKTVFALETIYLSVVLWCPTAVLALLFADGAQLPAFFWMLGTALPVAVLRLLCAAEKSRLWKLLWGLGITGLCLLLLPTGMKRLYYGLCCGLCLLCGLAIAWPQGKMTLTVPKIWHALLPLMTYALGKVAANGLLCSAAVLFAALMALLFALQRNGARLLESLREDPGGRVSSGGMVALNRRMIIILLLVGILLLAALPFLLSAERTDTVQQLDQVQSSHAPAQEPTEPLTGDFMLSNSAPDLDLTWLEQGFTDGILLLALALVVLVGYALISVLSSISGDRVSHRDPAQSGFVVENLPSDETGGTDFPLTGSRYARRLRRRYIRLIRGRTASGLDLAPMSPTRLEQAAGLTGPAAEQIHALYAKARYSPAAITKKDEQAFQAALRQLEETDP